jgi:hypothetical protein
VLMLSITSGSRYVHSMSIIDAMKLTLWQYFQGFRRGSHIANGTTTSTVGTADANEVAVSRNDEKVEETRPEP